MNYNIWGSPRTGSTYLQHCLMLLVDNLYGDVEVYGEIFSNNKKHIYPGNFDDRFEKYKEISTDSSIPSIFKVFFKQIEPKAKGTNNFLDKFKMIFEGSFNILIFREDLLDMLLSSIIMTTTNIKHTRDPQYYNSHEYITPSDKVIDWKIVELVESIRRTLLGYSLYEFDAVIRYEDLIGVPDADFPGLILPSQINSTKYKRTHPLKMNSLEHKKSILPYKSIETKLLSALEKNNIPRYLSFNTTNINSINW